RVLAEGGGVCAAAWGRMAEGPGVRVELLPGDWRGAVDSAALAARLRQDKAGEIKAVLTVQIDTASGAVNDIPAIRKAMNDAGHGALLAGDAIAPLGTMPFEMDAWGCDVAVTRSQNGPMLPAGPELRCRQRQGQGGARRCRPVHALLGLDRARRVRALPEVLRHAARAHAVRSAKVAGHAVRRGSRQGHRAASPVGRGRPPRRH